MSIKQDMVQGNHPVWAIRNATRELGGMYASNNTTEEEYVEALQRFHTDVKYHLETLRQQYPFLEN